MKTPPACSAVAILALHSLVMVLPAQSELFAWGQNDSGQLGDGTTTNRTAPVPVVNSGALAGKSIVSISAAGGHSIVLSSDGLAYVWGGNLTNQLPDGTLILNPFPALPPLLVPVQVRTDGVFAGSPISLIAARSGGCLVRTEAGRLYSWGGGPHGNGSSGARVSPLPVAVERNGALAGKRIVRIASGGGPTSSLVLDENGELFGWGNNNCGQLGNGSSLDADSPVCVYMGGALNGQRVKEIAVGGEWSMALTDDGKVFTWGYNGSGSLGDGSLTKRYVPVPVRTDGALAGKTVVAISAGASHALALTADGLVMAWGSNYAGGLGDGSAAQSRNVPGPVKMDGALAGKTVVAIAAGNSESYVLTSEGRVYAWGSNTWGQLGDGTTTTRTEPVPVLMDGALAGRRVTAIAAGGGHCLALAGSSAEIAVEHPAGNGLTDGAGSVDFGNVLTAAAGSRDFTIRNTGAANLTGLAITLTGAAAADFQITTAPAAPVGIASTTRFTVRFAPLLPGIKTAALHIASNDADENPFDIALTGRALAPGDDDDGDGLNNGAEMLLAGSGFDPLADNAALAAQLRAAGLYRAADMGTLALGAPVLERNAANGTFTLRLGVEKSAGLEGWTPLPGTVDFTIPPSGPGPLFFRVVGRKP